jgi:hypothetical protein
MYDIRINTLFKCITKNKKNRKKKFFSVKFRDGVFLQKIYQSKSNI